jgi:transposase
VLTDAAGLPLAVAVSAANTHDSLALIPLVQAIPAVRSRRGPRRRRPAKLHADKGYDYPHLRAWLRRRRITPRIARRGVETSTRLGRHHWVVERSFAWLTGYRRLTLRYERCARLFTAFLTLAAALTCYKEARHMRQALSMHEVVSLTTELLVPRAAAPAAGVRSQFRPEAPVWAPIFLSACCPSAPRAALLWPDHRL